MLPDLRNASRTFRRLAYLTRFCWDGVVLHPLPQFLSERLNIHCLEEFLDRFRTHPGAELSREFLLKLPIALFREQFLFVEGGFAGIHHNVLLKIENGFQVPERNVEQVTDAAGQTFEKPDVGAGSCQLNVTHALAPHLGKSHLDTALVANHPAVLHALVFSAQAFPVGDRAENLGAEKSIAFRFESPIVDSFWFSDFAMRPGTDLFGRSQTDANGVELTDQTDSIIRAAAEQGLPPI